MFAGKLFVLDGGLASTIQDKGFELDGDPLWSARLLETNPNAILEAHLEFLNSGAQILITASYQASIQGFSKYLNVGADKAKDLIKSSVSIARDAIKQFDHEDAKILVAGSIGPYGACQADGSEYSGNYIDLITEDIVEKFHTSRIDCLVEAGVDLVAIETIPSLREGLVILQVLDKFPGVKAWITFSCKNGKETNYGDSFREAVKTCWRLHSNKLVGIGVNCSHPDYVSSLLKEASYAVPLVSLPRIVYPNSGETWIANHGYEQNTAHLTNH